MATMITRTKPGQTVHHNVGNVDRWVSGAMGASMILRAGRRKTFIGKTLSMVGGALLITRAAKGHSMVYERLGVSSAHLEDGAGINIDQSITINRPRHELFQFWRDVTNLPTFMSHVRSITVEPGGRSHWVVEGPRKRVLEWDTEVFNERPDEYIAWKSVEGSKIEQAGSVHFTSAGEKGTEVRLKLRYVPPGGIYGFAYGKGLNKVTEQAVAEDLRSLKHRLETGIDISTQGQPIGTMAGSGMAQGTTSDTTSATTAGTTAGTTSTGLSAGQFDKAREELRAKTQSAGQQQYAQQGHTTQRPWAASTGASSYGQQAGDPTGESERNIPRAQEAAEVFEHERVGQTPGSSRTSEPGGGVNP